MTEDDGEASMRAQILTICVERLRADGLADATPASVLSHPNHAARLLALLRDCRPLPVIQTLIAEAETASDQSSERD